MTARDTALVPVQIAEFDGGGGMGLLIGAELVEAFMKEQQRQAMLKQQLATQQQLGADQAADPHMSQSATLSSHDMHHAVH